MEPIGDTKPKKRKLENIFDISETVYAKNEDIDNFYGKFRSTVCGHLKRKGDKVIVENGELTLLEDEIISPTFEEVIILWCLEKIDPSLPNLVKETFSNQLEGHVSLKAIQEEIFQIIPDFLECNMKNSIRGLVEEHENVKDVDFSTTTSQIFKKEEKNLQDCIPETSSSVMSMKNCLLRYEKPQTLGHSKKSKVIQNLKRDYTRSNQYVCRICLKTFKDNAQLTMHKRLHTASKDSYSSINHQIKKSRGSTQNKNQNNEDIYVCDLCDKTFNDETRLKKHIDKKHHSDHSELGDINKPTNLKSNILEPESSEATNIGVNDIESLIRSDIDTKMNDKPHEKDLIKNDEGSERDSSGHDTSDKNFDDFNDDQFDNHEDEEPDEKFARLKCKVCGKSFKDNRKLLFHKQMVHGNLALLKQESKEMSEEKKNQKIPCEICGKEVARVKLKTHLLYHEKRFNCTKCDIKFEMSNQYKDHMSKHHPESCETKKVFCEMCGKRVCNLKDHIKKRHTTKLKCSTCKRGFPNEEELSSHICKHFACDICEQKFILHKNLTLHKREHAGEFFHHCDFCEGMFHSKRRMLAHRRYNHTNTNGESHECDICNKKFSIPRILKRHKLIHSSAERPFKCVECGMAFKMNSHMKTHMKTHGTEKKYSCEGCGKQFISVGNLKQHREKLSCGVQENQLFKNRIEN